jgi:hypothetical protein
MANFVTNLATIQCSQGIAPGTTKLMIPPAHMADANGQPIATIYDIRPDNIPTFGMCNTEVNPTVLAATTAAQGVHTPAPCLPNVVGPWSPGSQKTSVGGLAALTKDSKCKCVWMGEISVISEQATTAEVG